ncbi:MAG: DUF1045 domain-containing protein [Hyphomicrobiales bacterium]|nr:DUF1045 domain-containing protein [Hyphomicrobiales bacterium]
MSRPRLAVYFAPSPTSRLWREASRIIGWDAEAGARLPFPSDAPCSDPDWEALTVDPRRYGFHATLKAPFELAEGTSEADLIAAAATFSSERTPFSIDLSPALLGDFVAFRPDVPSPALDRLAADCVVAFEPFRAPLDAAERARRLGADPSPDKIERVDRWGYPHVFEHFRFHMTLTGRLPEARREPVRAALAALVGDLGRNVAIDQIALFRQERRDGPFLALARFPFGGGA